MATPHTASTNASTITLAAATTTPTTMITTTGDQKPNVSLSQPTCTLASVITATFTATTTTTATTPPTPTTGDTTSDAPTPPMWTRSEPVLTEIAPSHHTQVWSVTC
ncbi:hypothetical protein SprV_0401574500 [Sparganum proliferum]